MATIIGLTGGIASGKSTVSKMFKELRIVVIDADMVAREVVEVGEEAYNKIVEVFGNEIIHEDRTINREKLGSIIFKDEVKREKLNTIVHPAVRNRMNDLKNNYIENGEKTIVLDIPLLFESKLTHLVDKIILVYVDPDVQKSRLMKRNGLTTDAAMARIRSQMPLEDKIPLADAVINNNGTISETFEQLKQILQIWKLL
ncbi:dephospho-CoA kinase [Calidifontibacillus oryziterrae]|uniref:dephospho-CoA kinase n=1 Tax=Calidifontibacillus oryziterrae TaxID=1191699 RepID=UPI0002E5E042|nr:dephospho-CoA kinase [Calidifontibacillus oryziterrae]